MNNSNFQDCLEANGETRMATDRRFADVCSRTAFGDNRTSAGINHAAFMSIV